MLQPVKPKRIHKAVGTTCGALAGHGLHTSKVWDTGSSVQQPQARESRDRSSVFVFPIDKTKPKGGRQSPGKAWEGYTHTFFS